MEIENKDRFISICENCIQREGIKGLMDWLERSDFYTAPASTRYHGNYPGGLLQHSLNVYDELKRLLTIYPEIQATPETVAIIALFHDLCKVNFYSPEKRNRKNAEGQWESYDYYGVKEKFRYGGHGSKSVFLCERFIRLTPEEAVAINCHMGFSDNPNVGNSFEEYPLAMLLHMADMVSSYMREETV